MLLTGNVYWGYHAVDQPAGFIAGSIEVINLKKS